MRSLFTGVRRTRWLARPWAHTLLAGLGCVLAGSLGEAQQVPRGQLGPAPQVTTPGPTAAPALRPPLQGLGPVDRTDRQAVVAFYNTVYLPALALADDWTGSVASCVAGTTSAAYADATLNMVNYFRAMTGLPASVTHEAVKDGKSQLAALMMTANNSLSHSPPSSWTCYTAGGAEAAGNSNLALGVAGASAVTLYMADPGTGNVAVGHRRWILYPPQLEMGTGSTFNANALWVIGVWGARPAAPDVVAWPPSGFVPYQLVYPRWSFSVNTSASVSFSSATVSMSLGGTPIALSVLASANGYGDNTLAWEPAGLSFTGGTPDQTVSVQVANVTLGGVPTTYSYTVTVVDPAFVPPPTFTDDPLVPRSTPVKAAHITELRQAVNTLRARYMLAAATWTDQTLTVGSSAIRAVHIVELRTALSVAYQAAGRTPPSYTRSALTAGTTITSTDISELRAAVLALW